MKIDDEFIPVNKPLLDGNEKKYLNDCWKLNLKTMKWEEIITENKFIERSANNFSTLCRDCSCKY